MAVVTLTLPKTKKLQCRAVRGEERLGATSNFTIDAFSPDPVASADVLGEPCALTIATDHGERAIPGIVTDVSSIMTSQHDQGRRYRLTMRSALSVLELRRRTFVFQNMTVPEILRHVLTAGGFRAEDVVLNLSASHAPRRYAAQFDETDASFVRRLCEEEGLYFRFELHDDQEHARERFVLEDTSANAKLATSDHLLVVDDEGIAAGGLRALDCRARHSRRAGHVTLRDRDPCKPALVLEGTAKAGTPLEQDSEVYLAPGRFQTPAEGKRRADLYLEALRATSETISFRSNALALSPGHAVILEPSGGYEGSARPDGKHVVVGLRHAWSAEAEGDRYELEAEAIPAALPYRLPKTTPRPVAAGLHSAIVTGARGEEIHPDENGSVFVRFPWDREGPTDHKSSLPVRVMQPNTPGSMLLPRVGWEVFVGFEDADPDRPYVLGRPYNAKQPPPVALPKNKTMTSLATYSSPGGGGENAITFDDGAGRQHLRINAASAKHTSVAANAHVQTAKVDNHGVGGSQTRSIGGKEDVSVGQAFAASMASQAASVGGMQQVFVKGNFGVGVGSETVIIGGALIEQVGNPAAGAAALAKSSLMSGMGALGKAGAFLAQGVSLAEGAIQGFKQGGLKGAAKALGSAAVNHVAGMVPGGGAVMATVNSAASPAPWHEQTEPPGAQEAGGGAGGAASDGSGAGGPGPGHRDQDVKGGMLELVGGLHGVLTPGEVGWKTTGASTFLVGGAHSTTTGSANAKTLGASIESVGALHVKSGGIISREVAGAVNTTIGGAYKSNSGGPYNLSVAGVLHYKIGGSLTLTGPTTFVCGGSKVVATSAGVLIEAGTITVNGTSKQSGKATHSS